MSDKKKDGNTGTSWKGDNFNAHQTSWDGDKNTRTSRDVNADKSGGWTISNEHSTDQNKSKGSPGRHK